MTKSTITRERLEELAAGQSGFNLRIATHEESQELARMALSTMDSEPAIADCDPEVYEKGVSVCLVAIPKETAEVICQNITAATGCKVDWHYFGGRVHIKALRVTSQPAPVVNGEYGDAYQGAREDLAIWKRRALEAEESVRRLEQINDHLVKEAQGESRMGEPVIAQPVADSEPDRNPVLAYADSYRDMAKQGVESVPIWSVITDLERNIAPLYRHAQPAPVVPVVPDDVLDALQKVARIRLDLNDFDGDRRGIADCLGDAEDALIEVVNRRAAMLHAGNSPAQSDCCPAQNSVVPAQSGNSPAIPDGYVLVPKEATKEILDEFDSIIDYGAEDSVDAWHRLLAAATQEVKP
ncbi:hypothetical protein [Klebsiella pneumoniae]|uniref:hypothetical protein n=1 Tax=Klebsiella pneumoniae TaxID=573 RepID=UPI00214B15D0|nr:hypothetical protein [Klebsiella pneumoniae]